jgi:hypothetical protein
MNSQEFRADRPSELGVCPLSLLPHLSRQEQPRMWGRSGEVVVAGKVSSETLLRCA